MKKIEDRIYLLECAAWQETLLQSYRSLHVTIQSILLAVGVAVTVSAIALSDGFNFSILSLICAIVLACIACLQKFSTDKFSGVVAARGDDINWWHKQIIRTEHEFELDSRFFTKFKIHQQAKRNSVSYLEETFLSSKVDLTDEQVSGLIGKGLGHTRKVIDIELFSNIKKIWWLLIFSSWLFPVISVCSLIEK